jgi:hypothetical protein
MKKTVLLLINLLLFVQISFAADNEDEKVSTLFDGFNIKSGGYGAFEMKLGPVLDTWGIMVGGEGGWMINNTFTIGGGGYALVSMHELENFKHPDAADYLKVNFYVGWGGILFEYTHNSNDILHWSANVMFGWGNAMAIGSNSNSSEINTENELTNDSFMMIEPGARFEANFLSWMRVGVGVDYRLPLGLELKDGEGNLFATSSDFRGISYCLTFKFGYFQ